MLAINTTTQSLEVILASAPTTALKCTVSFGEHTSGSYAAKNQVATISGTTAVTVLSAPASGYERVVRGITLHNVDSASATITLRLNDNGTYTTLYKATILTGYLLAYDDDGFYVMNDTGARLGVGPTGATGAAGAAGATGPQGPEGGSTTLTTKGDILTRDASNLARLPVGSNGQYLQADSSTTTGLLWTTPPTGAPAGAQYVTLALDGGLSSERVLTAGSNISITDGGANGNVTIAASGLATNTPQYVTLAATGDLTNERILTAGTGIVVTDGGAGSAVTISTNGVATNTPQFLTLAATGDLVNERVFTAGTGISVADAGAGSTYTVSVNQGALTHNNLGGLTTGDPHTQYLLESTVTTAGDLLYGTGASAITRLGIGSAGQVLTVSSGLPAWSTPTTNAPVGASYITLSTDATLTNERALAVSSPITGTDGGAGGSYTIGLNQAAITHNNLGGLTTGDPHTQYLLESTVTTAGDILYGTGSAAITRLGIGSTGQVLTVSGGLPAWATPGSGVTDHGLLTGLADDDHTQYTVTAPASSTRNVIQPTGDFKPLVIKAAATQTANLFEAQLNAGTVRASIASDGLITGYGVDASSRRVLNVASPTTGTDGVNQTYCDGKIPKSTVTTNGDLIYGTGSSTVTRLGIGSTGQVLTVSGGVPTWAAATGGVTDHGALTGLTDDDHGKYIFTDPASSTRNVIQPGGDFKGLVIKGSASQTANLVEGQLSAGTIRFSVSAAGTVTGYGFDSSNRAITNVADPTGLQDAATKNYVDGLVGGAPVGASYVVIGSNATLTSERVLTAGSGITITDGGANGNVTIAASGGGGGGAESFLLFQAGIF